MNKRLLSFCALLLGLFFLQISDGKCSRCKKPRQGKEQVSLKVDSVKSL